MSKSFLGLTPGPALRSLSLSLVFSASLTACGDPPKITATGSGASGGTNSGAGGSSGGNASNGGTTGGGAPVINLPDASAGGSTGATGLDAADAPTCGFQNFTLMKETPEILLVLDRSSSMNRPPAGTPGMMPMAGATLWTDTLTALDQVVKNTEGSVHWGLKMFPQPTACMVADVAEVEVAANNYMAVLDKARMTGLNTTSGG
ncbi:MAG TPA: hypothetical protein VGG33_07685, partial [Polyangia bacterium]